MAQAITLGLLVHDTLMLEHCCTCGCPFALSNAMWRCRKEDGKAFFCPNGHSQIYTETETTKLRRELESEKKRTELAEQRRKWAEEAKTNAYKSEARAKRRVIAYRGVITRTKKRIGNGVCPCCNRSFTNLRRHMTGKHPEYKK